MSTENTNTSSEDLASKGQAFLDGVLPEESKATSPEAKTVETKTDDVESLFEESKETKDERTIPYQRFQKAIQDKNEWKTKYEEATEQLTELEVARKESKEVRATFLEAYAEYENPADVLRQDKQIVEGIAKLYEAKDPDIVKAWSKIQNFVNKGVIEVEKTENQSNNQQSTNDPRLTALLTREWKSEVDNVLKTSPIRPELKSVIQKEVIRGVDVTEDPSRDAIVSRIKSVIEEYGWSREQLTGSASKSEETLPAPKGTATSTPMTSSAAKAESKDEPKTAQELRERLLERARSFASQHNISEL